MPSKHLPSKHVSLRRCIISGHSEFGEVDSKPREKNLYLPGSNDAANEMAQAAGFKQHPLAKNPRFCGIDPHMNPLPSESSNADPEKAPQMAPGKTHQKQQSPSSAPTPKPH